MVDIPSYVGDNGVLKSNGSIQRKSKLHKMNHLHPTCFIANYRSHHHCRKIMNQNKFLLLVMWSICVFIPYGRSLIVLLFIFTFGIIFSKCKWHNPNYVFCCNAYAIITLFKCTCIICLHSSIGNLLTCKVVSSIFRLIWNI